MKEQFPILETLTYLDTAATAQKPLRVFEAEHTFGLTRYANVHRGIYAQSVLATEAFEGARAVAAKFIGSTPQEIVFTKSTTEAMNLLAHTLPITKKSRIITSLLDHHSTFVPFQQAALHAGAEFVVLPLTKEGALDMRQAKKEIEKGCDVLAITQLSNVTGEVIDVEQLAKWVHKQNGRIVVDGAQAAAHLAIDVSHIDAFAFSGHKVYGPTGIGVLHVQKDLLSTLSPYQFGGEMIDAVTIENTTFREGPARFEAGTPPITQAVGLMEALRFVAEHRDLQEKERDLIAYCQEKLVRMNATIIGPEEKVGCVSFTLPVHAHDVAEFLDKEHIAVRAGHHCTQPLHDALGIPASVRISVGLYNTKEDIDRVIAALKACVEAFDV